MADGQDPTNLQTADSTLENMEAGTITRLQESKGNTEQSTTRGGSLELGLGVASLDLANQTSKSQSEEIEVTYYLRDINERMVEAWLKMFKKYEDRVKVGFIKDYWVSLNIFCFVNTCICIRSVAIHWCIIIFVL